METAGKIEKAYKLYCEAANKFHYVLKNTDGKLDATRMRDLKEKTQRAIDSGLWVKQQLDDKKAKMKGTMTKSKGEMTLGLRLCGANYMEAFNFYNGLGDFYMGLV